MQDSQLTTPRHVAIASLNDLANPFRGHYEQWDYWAYDHLDLTTDGTLQDAINKSSTDPDTGMPIAHDQDDCSWMIEIDQGRYPVPMVESLKRYEHSVAEGTVRQHDDNAVWYAANGTIDQTLRNASYQATDLVRAQSYMPVPEWLMNDLPEWAILLPNGEVISSNPVTNGRQSSHGSGDDESKDDLFYRYDSQGRFKGSTCDHWFFLYFAPGRQDIVGETEFTFDGLMLEKDPDTGDILRMWNYDGSPVTDVGTPPKNDRHDFQRIPRGFLQSIYESTHQAASIKSTGG